MQAPTQRAIERGAEFQRAVARRQGLALPGSDSLELARERAREPAQTIGLLVPQRVELDPRGLGFLLSIVADLTRVSLELGHA